VFGVVTLCGRLVERAHLHRGDRELLGFDPADDFAHEPAPHRVGLAQHERSGVRHGAGS